MLKLRIITRSQKNVDTQYDKTKDSTNTSWRNAQGGFHAGF